MAVRKTVAVQRRMAWFLITLLGVFFLLAGRIGWIQFVEGKRMADNIRNQLKDSRTLQSPRGTIYDRNGRELAVSSLTKSLYGNPSEVKDVETTAAVLAPLLQLPPEKIKDRLAAGGQFIWLQRMLEPEVSRKVEAAIKEYQLKGLGFLEESKRYYPNEALAAQVLGFVGTDDVGLDGLEMSLDSAIKGQLSEQMLDTDSRGVPIFTSIFSFAPPKQGKNVYLTLDSTIQFMVEQSLDKALAATRAQGAVVIVMNPKTGEVLAMASRPTYNPNQFYKFSDKEWKNRAVSFNYEPGSTFKSIVAAAGLQEGKVRPDERFIDNGYVEVSGRRIKNWSGESYGSISFIEIIKESINTGFVQVGMRLGAQKLTEYAKMFGFGKATGIEFPGEEEGLLFDPSEMRDSDVATMSIGHSIAVTPIQLITAVSAIANDGVLLKPYIIKEIRNSDGSLDKTGATQSVRQVISAASARTLADMMEKVVSEGGGKKAEVKGYHFAGKTGTAEKTKEGGGYYENRYISSFVGFGPVEDPQIAVLVVLDDPVGIYYGGQIAAPVAGEIIMQVMRYLNIHPQGGGQIPVPVPAKQEAVGRMLPVEAQPAAPIQVPVGKVLVPDVTGKSMREAGEMLSKAGLAMVPSGSGRCVKQSIPANTIVDPGTEMTVYFAP